MRVQNRNKQRGFIVSTELMLVATILVIGVIVGLQAVRTAVVTEMADLGAAIASTSQTYSYSGVAGHHASTNGSLWQDAFDTCDADVPGQAGQAGLSSRCIRICGAGSGSAGAPSEVAAAEDAPFVGASSSP